MLSLCYGTLNVDLAPVDGLLAAMLCVIDKL